MTEKRTLPASLLHYTIATIRFAVIVGGMVMVGMVAGAIIGFTIALRPDSAKMSDVKKIMGERLRGISA